MSETLTVPDFYYFQRTEAGHVMAIPPVEMASNAVRQYIERGQWQIDNLENLLQGIDVQRIDSYFDRLGLITAPYKVIASGAAVANISGRFPKTTDGESGGFYSSVLNRAVIFRDERLERHNGTAFTEHTIVHELAHSSAQRSKLLINPVDKKIQVSQSGFVSANPRTGAEYGMFFEEGFAERTAAGYTTQVFGSPNGILGGQESRYRTQHFPGATLPIFDRYYFYGRSSTSKLVHALSGLAATGLDLLILQKPELEEAMRAARSGRADDQREFRGLVDDVSPGLYAELRQLPYTLEGFTQGLSEVCYRLGLVDGRVRAS